MRQRCTYCGHEGHTEALCPKTYNGSAARNHLRCGYCGGRDHAIEACPKTWGGRRDDSTADKFYTG
jgi:DNA-directed RNA polymerase subunit RPC12/RpoP